MNRYKYILPAVTVLNLSTATAQLLTANIPFHAAVVVHVVPLQTPPHTAPLELFNPNSQNTEKSLININAWASVSSQDIDHFMEKYSVSLSLHPCSCTQTLKEQKLPLVKAPSVYRRLVSRGIEVIDYAIITWQSLAPLWSNLDITAISNYIPQLRELETYCKTLQESSLGKILWNDITFTALAEVYKYLRTYRVPC
jgi:hypothetical protein